MGTIGDWGVWFVNLNVEGHGGRWIINTGCEVGSGTWKGTELEAVEYAARLKREGMYLDELVFEARMI